MEGNRFVAAASLECRLKRVLAGVLLHVVKPPGPLDFPLDNLARRLARQNVNDLRTFINNTQNLDAIQSPGISGLAAGLRIKGRSIKVNAKTFYPESGGQPADAGTLD